MSLMFYGVVVFEDKTLMADKSHLGIARDILGWACGPVTDDIRDLKKGYYNPNPLQMHEFLEQIGKCEIEYCSFKDAKNKTWIK